MLWRFNMKHFRRNIHRGISNFFFFFFFFWKFLVVNQRLRPWTVLIKKGGHLFVTCWYCFHSTTGHSKQHCLPLLVNGCDHHGSKLSVARDKVTSLRKYKVGDYKRKYWVDMAFCCIWNESDHVPGSTDDASWWNLTLNSAFFAKVVL